MSECSSEVLGLLDRGDYTRSETPNVPKVRLAY